jgi:exopolysaccharide biosynthesis WecB/TagA/CpsF family protein
MEIKKVPFLKINVVDLSFTDIIRLVKEKVEKKESLTLTTINLRTLVKTFFSRKLRNIYNNMDVVVPVGIFLNAQIRRVYPSFHYKPQEGRDFITPFFNAYHQSQLNFMIFGSSYSNNVKRMSLNLHTSFPGIKLIGIYSKQFFKYNAENVKSMVKKGDVGIIFLGLGSPYDEKWVCENKDILKNTVSICVNDSVEVMAGERKDIPYSYRERNREFLYHLKMNPLRIFDFVAWFWISFKTFFFKRKVKRMQKKLQKNNLDLDKESPLV